MVTPSANPTGLMRILDDQGEPVPGTTTGFTVRTPFHGWLVFRPVSPFAASTMHSVEIDGMITSTFTTGTTEFTDTPAFDGVASLEAVLVAAGDDPSPCWRFGDSLDHLTLELSSVVPAVSHLIVDVRHADEDVYSFRVLVPVQDFVSPTTVVMSTDRCAIAGPELVRGQEYCASVTAYDAYGNASSAHEACSGPAECLGDSPTGRCAGSSGCSAYHGSPSNVFLLLALLPFRRWRRRT